MHGDFILIEEADGTSQKARRLPLGDTHGRNEAWLRDRLAEMPEIIPVADIDASYGPLIPLCRELRTEAGPIDLALVSPTGLLTIVECKLWRNPEARRKVVAQVLDYARAVAKWSYADLQREVARATGKRGNVPFELVREQHPDVDERDFVDALTRSMRSARFLLLVAGDGIREDIGAMAELINRNAALGFSFGLVEVALYKLDQRILVQPRVLARTLVIERSIVVLQEDGTFRLASDVENASAPEPASSGAFNEIRGWWQSLEGLAFDDPEQEPAKYYHQNYIKTPLPLPGTWIVAYRAKKDGGICGVFFSGRGEQISDIIQELLVDGVLKDLPTETSDRLHTRKRESEFSDADQERQWLAQTMNAFVNALRPRLKKIMASKIL